MRSAGFEEILSELERRLDLLDGDTIMAEGTVFDDLQLPEAVIGSDDDVQRARLVLHRIDEKAEFLNGLKARLAGELADLKSRGKYRYSAPESLDTLA